MDGSSINVKVSSSTLVLSFQSIAAAVTTAANQSDTVTESISSYHSNQILEAIHKNSNKLSTDNPQYSNFPQVFCVRSAHRSAQWFEHRKNSSLPLTASLRVAGTWLSSRHRERFCTSATTFRNGTMNQLHQAKNIWKKADAICFDVDSTVIQEEAIDELAKFCGKGAEVEEL